MDSNRQHCSISGCACLSDCIVPLIQIKQLEEDLQELGSLLEKAERKRVQDLLKQEQKKVEKELAAKRQQKEQQARKEADPSAATKAAYTVKITSYGMGQLSSSTIKHYWENQAVKMRSRAGEGKKQYFKIVHMCIIFSAAWDQSDKFVKIYLALKDVHKISAENVEVKFTERWVDNQHSVQFVYTFLFPYQCTWICPLSVLQVIFCAGEGSRWQKPRNDSSELVVSNQWTGQLQKGKQIICCLLSFFSSAQRPWDVCISEIGCWLWVKSLCHLRWVGVL